MAREVLYRVCYGTSDVKSSPANSYLASQLTIQPALLHNYRRHRVYGCDYPGMIAEEGGSVRGTYVTGLTDGDIFRLDVFEGSDYERVPVKVSLLKDNTENGEQREAETYVFMDKDALEKEEWDYEDFRRTKLHNWASVGSVEYDGKLGVIEWGW